MKIARILRSYFQNRIWLRVKGTDKTAQTKAKPIIYIIVNAKAMTIGSSTSLKILQDTFFKVAPTDSTQLNELQKVLVSRGKTLTIRRYGVVDGHLKVELNNAIAPLGDFGYFYEKHVQAIENPPAFQFGEADPKAVPPGYSLLTIIQSTKLKPHPEDSARLYSHEQVDLLPGQTFYITGYACVEGHFRVTFTQEIYNFGTKMGYVYAPHVQIKKDGDRIVPYDRNAINLTIFKTTAFKKKPVGAATLKNSEKITVPVGAIFSVVGYLIEFGHLKVSLTENLPGFGNTGYFYPDFVELSRGGNSLNFSELLSYQGPTEFLVNQPTLFTGSFNPQQVADVALIAENKYPLTVTVSRSSGTWQANLNRGFQETGARWLRLKGTDSSGKVVASQLIYINVSGDAATVGQATILKVKKDTLFKVAPIDSTALTSQQKILVKAGQTFGVRKYGLVDGHLKVTLTSSLSPVGYFGYFYEEHVQLNKGAQILKFDLENVPDTQSSTQMLVTQNTLFKSLPQDSSELADNQKNTLLLGQKFSLSGYACFKGHFRVTFTQSIPGLSQVGYVYWRDVQIKKDGKVVAYDPDALTITIMQTTAFKKQPVDAATLSATEKTTLPAGRVYGVSSYAAENGHLKVSLTEEFPNFGNTGYLYPDYIKIRRGNRSFDPFPNNQLELNVPYFSQRDNPRYYWSTCNVTSIAMVFYYYGIRSKWGGQLEDELLQWCFDNYGEGSQTDHSVLSALIRAYGFNTNFSTTRTWSELKKELMNGRPFVLAGDFTASGHILVVVGLTPQGFIVNDPWGDALTGYSDTEGRKLVYPYSYIDRVAGPDGNIWAHLIDR